MQGEWLMPSVASIVCKRSKLYCEDEYRIVSVISRVRATPAEARWVVWHAIPVKIDLVPCLVESVAVARPACNSVAFTGTVI